MVQKDLLCSLGEIIFKILRCTFMIVFHCRWLVETLSSEGDSVLDVGGLGRACQELKRYYMGIENDMEVAKACLGDFSLGRDDM